MRVLLPAETIAARVRELAVEIEGMFDAGRPICAVVVLRGASVFGADLIRQLNRDVTVEFVRAESYRGTAAGDVSLSELFEALGQQVLIIEDIIERGETLAAVVRALRDRGAERIAAVALLRKPGQLTCDIDCPVTSGFEIGPEFVVGYGMDFDGRYRNLSDVCVLEG